MAILRFQRPCPVIMILIITTLPLLLFGHPVILNITEGPVSGTIGLGEKYGYSFGEDFKRCICTYRLNPCYMPSDKVDTYTDPPTQAMSAENVDNYRTDANFFHCKYNFLTQIVRCDKEVEPSRCPSTPCTINIIIPCPDGENVVLDWASEQKPRVLSFNEIPVIDCCITSSNLTQLTTIPTTPTTTIFKSTHTTTDATTTTLETFNSTTPVRSLQSSSPPPDVMTISSTHSGTTNEQNRTNYESISNFNLTQLTTIPTTTIFISTSTTTDATRTTLKTFSSSAPDGSLQSSSPTEDVMTISSTHSGTTNEQNRTNYENAQISSQQISTFVVSTVVAILVTLAIVGIFWRLKSRRQRKESIRTTRVSANVQEMSVDNLTHVTSDGDNASRTIGLDSTLV